MGHVPALSAVVLPDRSPVGQCLAHALVRSGLGALIGAEKDLTVAGEAADGREAIERARALRLDVLLMDVRMPRLDGVSATREIVSWPQRPRVLVLTTFDLDEVVDDAAGGLCRPTAA